MRACGGVDVGDGVVRPKSVRYAFPFFLFPADEEEG